MNNKAIIDYTSPMLCNPVTPFPPIGNAAYRQRAGRGPSHSHRQHAQKIWFNDRVRGSGDMLTGRQTHRQTHRQMCSSEYFAAALVGKVMKKLKTKKPRCSEKKRSSRKFREVSPIYTLWVKKQGTTILSIASPNVDRFSNFFHWQIH